MKHIKTFESINSVPKIGDFAVVNGFDINSIGIIKDFELPLVLIAFIDTNHYSWTRIKNIEFSSPDKEEAEAYLQSIKYNL